MRARDFLCALKSSITIRWHWGDGESGEREPCTTRNSREDAVDGVKVELGDSNCGVSGVIE